ncbi:unnamed protein product [Pedinophyceae sp. YPF-701]|nr:unnamed protein product [Pedinophyceae sp. YPF-701]
MSHNAAGRPGPPQLVAADQPWLFDTQGAMSAHCDAGAGLVAVMVGDQLVCYHAPGEANTCRRHIPPPVDPPRGFPFAGASSAAAAGVSAHERGIIVPGNLKASGTRTRDPNSGPPKPTPHVAFSISLPLGEVHQVSVSPDHTAVAVLRGPELIALLETSSPAPTVSLELTPRLRGAQNGAIAVHWVDARHLLVCMRGGVALHKVSRGARGELTAVGDVPVDAARLPVSWVRWFPQARAVLVSSGVKDSLVAFVADAASVPGQLKLTRLPPVRRSSSSHPPSAPASPSPGSRLDVRSEALPVSTLPPQISAGVLRREHAAQRRWETTLPCHAIVARLYGGLCCVHVDVESGRLALHRLFPDGCEPAWETTEPWLRCQSNPEAVSLGFVDNLVVVYARDAGLMAIVDPGRAAPGPACAPAPPPAGLGSVGGESGAVSGGLVLEQPCTLFDYAGGRAWPLVPALGAIAETMAAGSAAGTPDAIGLLQRRAARAGNLLGFGVAQGPPAQQLTLSLLGSATLARQPAWAVSRAYHAALRAGALVHSNAGRSTAARTALGESSPAPTPTETITVAIQAARRLCRSGHGDDAVRYAAWVVEEVARIAESERTAVPDELHAERVSYCLRRGPWGSLDAERLVRSQPSMHCTLLGERLEQLAVRGLMPQGQALACDVYASCGAHGECCAALLRQGRVREAVQHARRWHVDMPPEAFLDAAEKVTDACARASLARFFETHVTGAALAARVRALTLPRRDDARAASPGRQRRTP